MTNKMKAKKMESLDAAFIRQAATYLERPGFLVKLTNAVGRPIEATLALLPQNAQAIIARGTQKALEKSLAVAMRSLEPGAKKSFAEAEDASFWSSLKHRAGTALTGAVGGFFGLAALPVELPVTTTLMLRSIAKIADDFGADLTDPAVQLECLTVFSLGSPTRGAEAMESAYFSARLGMAEMVKKAAGFLGRHSAASVGEAIASGAAPELVRLLSRIGARFEVVVTEKVVAEALPILGAATGAAINVAFSSHFDAVARFHFGIRALEQKYGEEMVKQTYLDRAREA